MFYLPDIAELNAPIKITNYKNVYLPFQRCDTAKHVHQAMNTQSVTQAGASPVTRKLHLTCLFRRVELISWDIYLTLLCIFDFLQLINNGH